MKTKKQSKIKPRLNSSKKFNGARTSAIVGAITLLMAAGGLTGYKLVKTGNYGGVEDNLHEVLRVVDGDTFEVEGESGKAITVRVLNMTTSERGECFYQESKKALENLLKDKKVKLEKDVSGEDSFGRLLRHVFVSSGTEDEDNIIVAKYMIEKGFAKAQPVLPDVRFKTYLARFGTEAEEEKLGAWKECAGKLPKGFAKTTNADPTDENCVIKGNVSQNTSEKIYFLPECPSYSQTRIDPSKGERYFCTETEAKSAGFKISGGCATIFKKK
ncbi:MAG: thermonuclease family protein [Candidatus Moranbacteria bacterium]|nr:thermonuclease family protein [Candidatus Moranbacteria bacterium]